MLSIQTFRDNRCSLHWKVTQGLILSQFLPPSLQIPKELCNREFQSCLRSMRDVLIKLKDASIIVSMSIHLSKSLPQTRNCVTIHEHVINPIFHRAKHPAQDNTVINIPLPTLRIIIRRLSFSHKEPMRLAFAP
ncbi:hypothetical protein CsSME_00026334 [Camellia sinensis var. sinensis]